MSGLDNRLTINGGSNGPDWNADDEPEERTREQEMADEIAGLRRSLGVVGDQLKVLRCHVGDFVRAVDRGVYFTSAQDVRDSAFVKALRNAL